MWTLSINDTKALKGSKRRLICTELINDFNRSHYSVPERPASIVASKDLRLQPQLFDTQITSIAVIGTPTPDNTLFHFRLSLINGPPEDRAHLEAIRLNMSPSHTDPEHPNRGVLLIEYLAFGVPPEVGDGIPFSIAVRNGTRVRDICNHLLDTKKVDLYDFTPEGSGCRHWCAMTLEHLATVGFIDASVGQMFRDYEDREGAKNGKEGPNFIMPRIRGTFYA